VVYGIKHTQPIYAWLAKPTRAEDIPLDNVRPHNMCVSPDGQIAFYEFRAGGNLGFSDDYEAFLKDFIAYIKEHRLERIIGLQLLQGPVTDMTEIAFSTCTIMLEESGTESESIPTGWRTTDDGVNSLTVYETHGVVDGVHRRFNAGAPGNIEEAIDCLRKLGVLK